LRVKYKDNSQLRQRYINEFMEDALNGKVFEFQKRKLRKFWTGERE
jgi:hypothetical protein